MLTLEQDYVIALLRRTLANGSEPSCSDELDARAVVSYIRQGGVLLMAYPELGGAPDAKHMLQNEYYAAITQNVNQLHEGERVLKALNEAGFRCIPLKGWDLRDLYPQAIMRQMTDVDLLIENYDYDSVVRLMTGLGFRAESPTESFEKHDVFNKGVVTFEIHKRLSDDSGPIRDWEACMWKRAIRTDDGWHMSPEDRYLFHFVHMGWDFQNGWFGLRRVVDAWLLERGVGDLDCNYVDAQLRAMGLFDFRNRMVDLGCVVMGEKPLSEESELLLSYAFDTGIYGNDISHKAAHIAMMSDGGNALGGLRSKIAHVFLPYSRMKAQFPELERWPVLLPVCWVRRIMRVLTSGKLDMYRHMMDYSNVEQEDVDQMRRIQRAGGMMKPIMRDRV